MSGSYSPYPVSLQLLQKHKFCDLEEFQSFINKYQHSYGLHMDKSSRAAVKQNFLSLRMEAPFSKTKRFPDKFYIDMDCAKIRAVTKQFLNVQFLLDLWEHKEANGIHANRISVDYMNTVNEANFVFTKFADIMLSTDINHLEENGIYCKQTIEGIHRLIWYPQD